jgi:hypothetical protein
MRKTATLPLPTVKKHRGSGRSERRRFSSPSGSSRSLCSPGSRRQVLRPSMSSSGLAKRRAAYHGWLRPLSRRRLRPPCQALRPRLRSRHPSRPTRPPPRPSPRRGRSRSPSSRPSVSRRRPICRRTVVAASAVALTLAGLSSRTRPSRPGLTAGYGVSSRASPDLASFSQSRPASFTLDRPSLHRRFLRFVARFATFRPLNSGPTSLANLSLHASHLTHSHRLSRSM